MGGARLFLLGGQRGGGQGAGHVGADISHGRALDGCMDDNWGGGQLVGGGGQGQGTGGSCTPLPPLEPPMGSSLKRRTRATMCVYK